MKIETRLITPEIAKELLNSNQANRRPKLPVVLRYASDMAAGKWRINTAEPIKISKNGLLMDGQHRLLAVIKSGMSIYFLIASGLEESVFDVLDTGTSRNGSDVFKIAGIKNENVIPSVIAMYHALKTTGYKQSTGLQKHSKLTNQGLLDLYGADPGFWDEITRLSCNWYNAFAKILTPSTIGGIYATLSEISEHHAYDFMTMLCTGEKNTKPLQLLRQRLMQDKMSLRKINPSVKIALILKTWNYYRTNKNPTFLRFTPDVEAFPIPL